MTGDVGRMDAERFLEETGTRWLAEALPIEGPAARGEGYGGVQSWGAQALQALKRSGEIF